MRSVLCALATLLRSASSRPASPAPAAMPSVAALAVIKLRRRGPASASSPDSSLQFPGLQFPGLQFPGLQFPGLRLFGRGPGRRDLRIGCRGPGVLPRVGGPRGRTVPGRRADQGNEDAKDGRRGCRRGHGRQQAGEAGGGAGRGGGQPDDREHRQPGHADPKPPRGLHPDQGREQGDHHEDAAHQDEFVVRTEVGDGEVLQPRRREIDLQLTDRDHGRSAGPCEAGHELPHAQRGGGGQQAGDSAAARATRVCSAPLRLHVLYSVRRWRGFAVPVDYS